MNREEFDRLVRAVETGVGRDPAALRRRTVLLALAGYVGLLFWFLMVLVIVAGFLVTMIWADTEGRIVCAVAALLVLVLGGWASLRILLVGLVPPKHRVLKPDEAPALLAVLDELRTRLQSAPFHEVQLTPEFNASVMQLPRLGVLGWSRNYLLLGLPLLDALSPDEMRAVLAHEFAHLSRDHGRLFHWLYRLRRSWQLLFEQFAASTTRREHSLQGLTLKFVNRFWPHFNAHAFVLSRAQEYEADAQSARLAGKTQAASALIRISILASLMSEEIWPRLWRRAQAEARPPTDTLLRIRDGLRAGADDAHRARWTEEAFKAASTNSDTHPCLAERLRALGATDLSPAGAAAAAAPSAAEALLGARLEEFRRDVQQSWEKDVAEAWTVQHKRATNLSSRLTSIDGAPPEAAASVETLWDKAETLLDLNNNTSAEPILRQILAREENHAVANLQLGRLLLETGQAGGEALLERAMAANEDFVPAACNALHNYYRRIGRTDQLKALTERLDRHEKELVASHRERASVTAADEFLPHGLTGEELDALRRALGADPALARASLAQKKLQYFKHQRLFVLCIRRRREWFNFFNADPERDLVRRVAQSVRLPGRLLVISPQGSFRSLGRKIERTGSAVWPQF